MNKVNNIQKKNPAINYFYAVIVAMLVIACAVTVALVGAKNTSSAQIGDETVPVAGNVYVVPMKNATVAKDYSGAELQYNATLKQWEIHKAIDFLAGEDLNVYAIADGTVSNVYTNYLEGTVIEISHKDGVVSVYKSLTKETNVSIGDKVSAGDVIGKVGETMAQELNAGYHLHFEMTKNGVKVNPNDYLDLGDK